MPRDFTAYEFIGWCWFGVLTQRLASIFQLRLPVSWVSASALSLPDCMAHTKQLLLPALYHLHAAVASQRCQLACGTRHKYMYLEIRLTSSSTHSSTLPAGGWRGTLECRLWTGSRSRGASFRRR